MMNKSDWYTNLFKHNVLTEYRPGVYGFEFKSLAKRFKIKGGHKLIMHWYRQWDGTVESLNQKLKGGRPRTMTKKEVKLYILDFVNMMNNQYKPVNYKMVQLHIEASLDKKVPLSTIQRYGKEECGIKCKKTQELKSRDSKCIAS
jgi:transposase